jgi:hypothetical protein
MRRADGLADSDQIVQSDPVPYCEACAKHWTPTSMNADGSCPSCGDVLPPSKLATAVADKADERSTRPVPRAPWHFKLLLGSLIVYLGWRAFQGVEWLAGRF